MLPPSDMPPLWSVLSHRREKTAVCFDPALRGTDLRFRTTHPLEQVTASFLFNESEELAPHYIQHLIKKPVMNTLIAKTFFLAGVLLLASFTTGCDSSEDDTPTPTVITASGDITGAINEFRTLLGPLNTTPDPQFAGRREINWDGVPDQFAAPFDLPPDFFRGRGALYSTPGTAVQVSADSDNPDGALPRFGNINPNYAGIFQTFSAERLFSPVGSNIVDLTFVVPGTSTPAVSRGFGAVYTDVDAVENTAFEYFDAQGNSLGTFATPIYNNGLSFLGVVFPEPVVHRVRIEYGNAALGPDDSGNIDVAVMDDFVFGEPQAQ